MLIRPIGSILNYIQHLTPNHHHCPDLRHVICYLDYRGHLLAECLVSTPATLTSPLSTRSKNNPLKTYTRSRYSSAQIALITAHVVQNKSQSSQDGSQVLPDPGSALLSTFITLLTLHGLFLVT